MQLLHILMVLNLAVKWMSWLKLYLGLTSNYTSIYFADCWFISTAWRHSRKQPMPLSSSSFITVGVSWENAKGHTECFPSLVPQKGLVIFIQPYKEILLWKLHVRFLLFRLCLLRKEYWTCTFLCPSFSLQQPPLWKRAKIRRTRMTLPRPWTPFWEISLSPMSFCLTYGELSEMWKMAECRHLLYIYVLMLPSQSLHL